MAWKTTAAHVIQCDAKQHGWLKAMEARTLGKVPGVAQNARSLFSEKQDSYTPGIVQI